MLFQDCRERLLSLAPLALTVLETDLHSPNTHLALRQKAAIEILKRIGLETELLEVSSPSARSKAEDEIAREKSSQRMLQRLEFFESLAPEQQQKLRVEVEIQAQQDGFLRLPGWGPAHPAYRGLLSELVSALEAEVKQRE